MDKYDYLIVGAGIVGLATAYKLLQKKPKIKLLILEKESDIAQHQTGKNSGVVHSGLYYKPGSLKAKNCVTGRKELLDFCAQFKVPCKKSGKIITATEEEELPRLYELEKKGNANGVKDLKIISKKEAQEMEPYIDAIKALQVPNCHIVDYYEVSKEIKRQIEKLGGKILLNEKVIDIKKDNNELIVITKNNEFKTDNLINCAGLYSDIVAKLAMPQESIPLKILPFRGEYYDLKESSKKLVKALIYPVPDPRFPFLGVHLTHMINHKVEAGPNAVLAFAREGYKKTDINIKELSGSLVFPGFWIMALKFWKMGLFEMYRSFSKKAFLKSLQRLVPAIKEEDIIPGGAGIRAQAVEKNGKIVDDFAIIKKGNMVHVLNAPSPAATACFSIGDHISNLAINQ